MRLDLFLVSQGLASSRTQAKEIIEEGFVFFKDQVLKKTSLIVSAEMALGIRIQENRFQKYVSRAGLKLEMALKKINLNVENKIILDVGQSTGGFTDCLLQLKAQKVIGIDVGHDQLNEKIRKNQQVVAIEGLNAKDLALSDEFIRNLPVNGFDLIVMDISFISIVKVMSFIKPFLKKKSEYLFLVKPQFEAGPNALDKNGIVKDDKIYQLVQNNVEAEAVSVFGDVKDYFMSELTGKDGNQEFFIYGTNQK